MSIKPIINDTTALDNKSLNIYANSISVNTLDIVNISCTNITSTGLGTFNDITATGDVVLKGNQIPVATTTPGFILQNTDGSGDLQWVSPTTSAQIITERTNPFLTGYGVVFGSTSSSTGTFDLTYDILYQSIDKRVTVTGLFNYTTGVGGNAKNSVIVNVPPVPPSLIKSPDVDIRGTVCGTAGLGIPSITGTVKYDAVINNIQLDMIVDLTLVPVVYDIQWTASYIID